jgi:S-adenosylmethionine decarboxylase
VSLHFTPVNHFTISPSSKKHMEATADIYASSAPFEGPEKLLEIWFAPSPADVPGASSSTDGRYGLRVVEQSVWEDMLSIVKCQVLSVVKGTETDAYLLR